MTGRVIVINPCGKTGEVVAIIPQPRFFTSPDEIETYPVVFKRPLGQGGDSVYFPKNRRALENLLKTESHPVVQEYIEGETYFLEANPRFSGGLETTLASGLDLPWLLLHTQRF